MNTTAIIEKWYKKLPFPKEYDEAFYAALKTVFVSPDATLDAYDKKSEDGIKNLLHYLYFCEKVEEAYAKRGIPEEILVDTLSDIVIWTKIWSDIKGSLYLGELAWLTCHLSARLYKVGRLQFCIPRPENEKGRATVEVHIPAVGKLTPELASASIASAKEFFATYFPEYSYDRFTCDSWLLDETLKKYLPENSNIICFGNMFTRTHKTPSDALLRYIFRWDIERETLDTVEATSSLGVRVKEAIAKGETFYETYGYILK